MCELRAAVIRIGRESNSSVLTVKVKKKKNLLSHVSSLKH